MSRWSVRTRQFVSGLFCPVFCVVRMHSGCACLWNLHLLALSFLRPHYLPSNVPPTYLPTPLTYLPPPPPRASLPFAICASFPTRMCTIAKLWRIQPSQRASVPASQGHFLYITERLPGHGEIGCFVMCVRYSRRHSSLHLRPGPSLVRGRSGPCSS